MNNNSEKVDMLFTYWECQKNTRLAKETYLRCPNRQHPSHTFCYKLEKNLRDTGSFSKRVINQQPRRGNAIGEDIEVSKNVINSRIKFSPILEKSKYTSKIMDRDIKKIESVIYQKEQPIVLSNLKISKEVTITSITNVNNTENNVILKLKKLPGITIDLVKSEPVFKVPEAPKLKTNNNKNNMPHNKLKILLKKKGLSEIKYNNTEAKDDLLSHNNINISNTNLNQIRTLKRKSKQTFNNISLATKSSDKGILKNPEVTYKKYPVLEKENFQRTSSPKKLSKKIQSSSKIKSKSSKTIKLIEEVSNNCKISTKEVKATEKVSNNCNIFSKEVKTVSDMDAIINNTEFKTNELDNENYMLMDLSTDGQFNIVPASFPLDFTNVSVPEYDNFLMGINKSSKDRNMHLETSQNDSEKGSIIIKEKLDHFSNFLGCVNTSLNINESNDIYSEVSSQFYNNGNPLDNINDEQLYINDRSKENLTGKIEDEQNQNPNFYFYNNISKQQQLSLQYNDMNQTTDTSIIQEENQLLQKVTSYYCDNSIENISTNENNLMDFNIPIQQILPNNK